MKNVLNSIKMRGGALFAVFFALAIITAFWVLPMIVSSKTEKNGSTPLPKAVHENYDIRSEINEEARNSLMQKRGLLNQSKRNNLTNLGQTMRAAKDRLARQKPNLNVEWSKQTGAPEIVGVLSAEKKLTGRSKAGREDIVRGFLTNNNDLYGLNKNQVLQLKKAADYTNPGGNMSFVELEQQIDGIPVFQGNIRGGLTKEGELIRTTGLVVPGLDYEELAQTKNAFVSASRNAGAGAEGSAAQAVVAAARTIGVEINPSDLVVKEISDDGTSIVFERGPFADDIKLDLVYFPLEGGTATLSWSTVLWQDVPAYYTLVDAESGDLLWRKNITNDQTQTATYNVYAGESPAPFAPFTGLPGSNIQAPPVPRTNFTLISEHPSNNNGWITDGGTTTTGNNVDAGLDIVSPDGIDAGGRPVSPTRNFVYDYNPAPEIPGAPGSSDPTDVNYRWGAVTNLFFWSNRYHDVLYQYGFTEAARNFQLNNFGRGGLGNDYVRAEAQDSSGTNNANFSSPADGSLPRMQMFIWNGPTPNRDGDLDQTIVIHELTHGTSNRLHNNSSGLTATVSGGMGEGWSDFYARMILSSADEDVNGIFVTGGYATNQVLPTVTDNYYYGIRRFPHAVKTNVGPNGKPHNPLTLADINPSTIDLTDGAFPRGPFGVGGRAGAIAVHNIGEVWSIALFEVRARIISRMGYEAGNARMMQLTTDAMKLDPTNPNLVNGRDALLAADVAFGSEDALDIWAGFATRGIGYKANIPSATNHFLTESFDNPIPGMETVTVTEGTCGSNGRPDAGEKVTLEIPLRNPLTQALTGVTAQVAGGSANYGTINPGQTVTQSLSYQIPSDAGCGSKINVDVQVTSNLGVEIKTFPIRLGTPTAVFAQNFDGVTAPNLPAGWTRSGSPNWVTSTTTPDSAPNVLSTTYPGIFGTSNNQIESPSIAVPAGNSQLRFRHTYSSSTEAGGVLEISIDGGDFVDILDAGGSFDEGGYNWVVTNSLVTSALQNRAAWSGNSGGYITTLVNMPASAAGKNVRLRFRSASSLLGSGGFWRIDSLSLNMFICPQQATTTTVAASSGQYSDPTTLSATLAANCDYAEGSMEFRVEGVLVGTVPVNGSGTYTTQYTIVNAPGNRTITANFVSSNPYFANSSGNNTLSVGKEDASVAFPDTNPFSVKVNSPGGTAGPIEICADITEIPDGSAGDTINATAAFSISPVAGGGSPAMSSVSYSGGGVGGTRRACVTLTNVAVDVYDITVTVGGYYQGTSSTILAIYDPSLGFVTGGGTVIHNGNVASFGISVKYLKNGKPQGSVLYIEHLPDGTVIKVKSNSMQSLSIVGGTALILAKATVNGDGNYGIRMTAVDNGDPGSGDQLGLTTTDPSGANVPDLTFGTTTLRGGNIQVPQNPRN